VKRVPVDEQGLLRLDALQAALEPGQTALVSAIWANNETGVIEPMAQIAEMAHAAGAMVHADAVQMAGKAPVDAKAASVDYLSLSGHKMHATKGIGALFVSRHAPFRATQRHRERAGNRGAGQSRRTRGHLAFQRPARGNDQPAR
jgi:cysteine desulfurase